ncbi:MAG: thioredoxin-like domain-containing protein, partial [Flavitalea sp.]
CREEIPMLKEVEAYFRNRGVNIASISIDTNEENWKKAIAVEKMPWQQYIVDSAKIGGFLDVLNVQGIPVTFIVDGQKMKIKRFDGSDNSTKQQLIDLIEAQLGAGWKLN